MLKALAGRDETMSDVLRALVLDAYRKRFGDVRPRETPPPTIRGIIRDVAGPIHYTVANIAKRTGASVGGVLEALRQMERYGLVERIDGREGNSSWGSLYLGGVERLTEAARDAGFSLDMSIIDAGPERWSPH